jgi:hypothetical protein
MRSPSSLCVCALPYFFVFYVVRVVSKESRRLVLPQDFLFLTSSEHTISCCDFSATSEPWLLADPLDQEN